jgi:hypothetical protein
MKHLMISALLLAPLAVQAAETSGGGEQSKDMIDIADKEWRAYIEPLLPLGGRVAEVFPQAEDPQLRQEMFRMLYSELGAGFMHLVYESLEHPDFIPNWTQVFNNAGNLSPDNVYQFALLDDEGVYKISGFRGTVRIVDFQIGNSSTFAYGKPNEKGDYGPTLADYDIDDLDIGKNGEFEFILSAKRPEGYKGNWWHLPPGSNYMVVRQMAYDWINEVDARIAIDRLDSPAARPRQTAEQIKAGLQQIPGWAEHWVKSIIGPKDGKGDWTELWGTKDKIVLIDFTRDYGGRAPQSYIAGEFELESDEALLVELQPGKCRFWNLHLANELLNTLDFMNRQVSLNGFTAKADSDGRYRIVISEKDPGVPNWLDTMGYKRGYIWGRLDTCENNDAPTKKKVAFADVRKLLPKDTPNVTPEQREASIRERRKGAQLRRRW